MNPDMIARMAPTWQGENWQKAFAAAIRDPAELLAMLHLPDDLLPAAQRAASQFPLRVPLNYIKRIEMANPADPLLLQVLPLHAELTEAPVDFSTDPVGDLVATPIPGLIHKYQGRVLLITTGACAIHCRYCFRRHFPYADECSTLNNLDNILDYIRADTRIEEVILSGGDPLSLSNTRLQALGNKLTTIPHLQRLRIHTRQPIVLPERIDDPLLAWLRNLPLQTIMVIHCNHANEINPEIQQVLRSLADTGLTLLNQSVLLRGINDTVACLKALSERLFRSGVLPYYLHQLDRVAGAQHFEVTDKHALALMKDLSHRLPGYLVPKLVRETAGEASKQLV